MPHDEYDDYADAVSPTSERTQTRTRARKGAFLGGLWQKFNALPAQTKVLIIGAIVVVGIVIYLNVKGKSAAAQDDTATSNQIPGQKRKRDKEQPPAPYPPLQPVVQPPVQQWSYWPLGILDARYQPVNQSGSTLGPGGVVGPLAPGGPGGTNLTPRPPVNPSMN